MFLFPPTEFEVPSILVNVTLEHNPHFNDRTGILSGATMGQCSLLVHLLSESDTQNYADRNSSSKKHSES
jgi:hypothetical protein